MSANWASYRDDLYFPDNDVSYAVASQFREMLGVPNRAKGFDTSYWNHGNADNQKPIDFQAAYDAGYRFWFGRLTRGQNYIDTWIERDYVAASRTPLVKCVYHVLYPGEPVGPHIENLRRGLALLPEPPKAIGLDLERGAEFGAAAVTKCLVDTVDYLDDWWTGKLLLYVNLNYLRNYIKDTCGLDIWLSWPGAENDYNPIDNPPIDCVIYQRSYRQKIEGLPDVTVDHDEFMGDEVQCFQYFNAFEPPEPTPEPEDNMNVIDRLTAIKEEVEEIIAYLQGVPVPPAPPAPANVRNFKVEPANDKDKANARCISKLNDAGKPIFVIYPNDSAPTSERQQFTAGVIVQVEGDIYKGDSGVNCYQLYDPESRYKFKPLFIRKDDGSLLL